jgi:hypothetical protein
MTEDNDESSSKKKIVNKRIALLLSYFSMIATGAALVISALFVQFKDDDITKNLRGILSLHPENDIDSISARIGKLERHLKDWQSSMQGTAVINMDSLKKLNAANFELNQMKHDINNLLTQLHALNTVIMDNPEKALRLPMMKQQIDNLGNQSTATTLALKEDISRVYDMNKWIFGLVITMLVSLIALNVSNLLTRKQKTT